MRTMDPLESGVPDPLAAGHRLVSGVSDIVIEAWGPDRAACLTEAMNALSEVVAKPQDVPAVQVVPVEAGPGEAADALVTLLQQVLDDLAVLNVVPVRVHLAETEDGGVAGDMEVVSLSSVRATGRRPTGLFHHDLTMEPRDGGWRCHVRVDG